MKVGTYLVILVLAGCNGCRQPKQKEPSNEEIQQGLIQTNRNRIQEENSRIQKFLAEKKWPMTETKTGLRYWIYENGSGKMATNGLYAEITFQVTLLDGTLCYESTAGEPFMFMIGQDNVATGLHEGILYMKEGDRARFVLPSHLAYGFTGDSAKIPQDATLVYDVHLLRLQ